MKISTVHTNVPVIAIPIMETFLTIQGEGFHTGRAAYFIRTAGCDVGCVWCDVKESWETEPHTSLSIDTLAGMAESSGVNKVVITGGEPLMYDMSSLTSELSNRELQCHLETSGVYPLTGNWNWICFSPKKFRPPLDEFYDIADELKIIVYNKSDLKWADAHAQKCKGDMILYLQPEWSRKDEIMPAIIEFVKQNPKWRISLQTHKYLDIP